VWSGGLVDVYKRQIRDLPLDDAPVSLDAPARGKLLPV
jgi:hypothetical protein